MNGDGFLIVQLSDPSPEGHGYYRVAGPARLMSQAGATLVDCPPTHRWAGWLAEHADVLVLHTFDPEWVSHASRRRGRGQATLLDASDNFLDVQPWTRFSAAWLDRSVQDQFFHALSAVDAVQTSTTALAEVWKPWSRKVVVAPNPPPPWGRTPVERSRPLTLGWAGSATHLPDWFRIAKRLEHWVRSHANTRLAVMTDELASSWIRLPAEQYRFRPNGTLAEYQQFLDEVDIGVVALTDNPFNRGRTALKWEEFAASGVVGVVARGGPYDAVVDHGKTGFLFASFDELEAVLDSLQDPGLVQKVRSEAWVALRGRSNDAAQVRLSAYRELLGTPPRNPELPAKLRNEFRPNGRHWSLLPGEPEALIASAWNATDASLLRPLAELRRNYPGFVAADRAYVRLLIRLGRGTEALAEFGPLGVRSPGVLAELAGASGTEGSVALLRRSASLAPTEPNVWMALQKAAGESGEPGEPAATAARATIAMPRNHLAALMAVSRTTGEVRLQGMTDWLERFPPTAHAEEEPYLAAAFSTVLGADPSPEYLSVVQMAFDRFPHSAKLAAHLGRMEYDRGNVVAATMAWSRAAAIARIARGFQAEYSDPDFTAREWLVADSLRPRTEPTHA